MLSNDIAEQDIHFIKYAWSLGVVNGDSIRHASFSPSPLSEKHQVIFEIVFRHFTNGGNNDPLKMIIQGITSIDNSSLIHYISHALSYLTMDYRSPLLFLALDGIVAFNIHGKTMHSAFKIPIEDVKSLTREILVVF